MDAKSVTHAIRPRGLASSSHSVGEAAYKDFINEVRDAIDAREYGRLDQMLDENPDHLDAFAADSFPFEKEIERVLGRQKDFWRFEKGEKWASIGMRIGSDAEDVVLLHALCFYFLGDYNKMTESLDRIVNASVKIAEKRRCPCRAAASCAPFQDLFGTRSSDHG